MLEDSTSPEEGQAAEQSEAAAETGAATGGGAAGSEAADNTEVHKALFENEMKYCTLEFIEDPGIKRIFLKLQVNLLRGLG